MNGLLLQGFEWYLPDDGKHFNLLESRVEELKSLGFTAFWLPPLCKATGTNDVGYGIYDLYDLGEFDQKGSVRTKYGTKADLKSLINKAHNSNISIYADVVLNHKAGADETEIFKAIEVSPQNRDVEIGEEKDIEGWTKFNFDGRDGKYSNFTWNHNHFSGVDWDEKEKRNGIYKIIGFNKGWSLSVSNENGNFDYLMNANIDHNNEEVKADIYNWSKWFIEELGLDGFRFDAVKHIDSVFIDELASYIRADIKEDFFFVGEYWLEDLEQLKAYISKTSGNLDLFDVILHYNFHRAGKEGGSYDMRRIFDDTLVKSDPLRSVTFVDNHDSQKGQALESWVDDWFRQIAYSLILLRKDGYPTVFYGDLYGLGNRQDYKGMGEGLKRLLNLRKDYAYGDQEDYFDDPDIVGFVRKGDQDHPSKLAVVISNKDLGMKRMFVGIEEAGKDYYDYLRNNEARVKIAEDGFGDFPVSPGSVSAWVAV